MSSRSFIFLCLRLIAKIIFNSSKVFTKVKMYLYKTLFAKAGKNVVFNPNDVFSYSTIQLGSDVFIGPGAKFSASESFIIIHNKVMFGPNVTIMGGDHNTSQLGRYMFDVTEKLPENDQGVVIKEDVWVGADSTILKGVTVEKGAIIAAGSLVLKDVAAYSVVGGVPAKEIKKRFTDEEIKEHERKLNVRN